MWQPLRYKHCVFPKHSHIIYRSKLLIATLKYCGELSTKETTCLSVKYSLSAFDKQNKIISLQQQALFMNAILSVLHTTICPNCK